MDPHAYGTEQVQNMDSMITSWRLTDDDWATSRVLYYQFLKQCMQDYDIRGGVKLDIRVEDPITVVRSNGCVFFPLRMDSRMYTGGPRLPPAHATLVTACKLDESERRLLMAAPREWLTDAWAAGTVPVRNYCDNLVAVYRHV